MGWWQATPDGGGQTQGATGLLWGDQVADIMSDALEKIDKIYFEAWGRQPTKAELMDGLKFSLGDRL